MMLVIIGVISLHPVMDLICSRGHWLVGCQSDDCPSGGGIAMVMLKLMRCDAIAHHGHGWIVR